MCVYGCVCVSTMSVINRNFSGKFAFIVCSSSQLFFFMQIRKRIFQFNRIINHHHHHISNDYYFHFQFLLSLDGLHSVILLYSLLFFQLNSYVYVFRFIDCRAKKTEINTLCVCLLMIRVFHTDVTQMSNVIIFFHCKCYLSYIFYSFPNQIVLACVCMYFESFKNFFFTVKKNVL